MLSKRQQQHITSLHQKKYRQQHDHFIVEGDKMAAEALADRPDSIVMAVGTENWMQQHQQTLSQTPAEIITCTDDDMRKITALSNPSPVLFVMRPWTADWQTAAAQNLVLYCDGIADPGNLGTIIRIAGWFGIAAVICSPDSCEILNPKTVQSTMGAIYRVPTAVMSLATLHTTLPEHPIFGAVFDGKNVFEVPPPPRGILVIGSESHGIRPEAMLLLHERVTIFGRGSTESLNAAVATGIICATFRR